MKSRRGDAVRISEVHKRIERAAWRAESLANRTPQYTREERRVKIAELVDKYFEGMPEDEIASHYFQVDRISDDHRAYAEHRRAMDEVDERSPEHLRLFIIDWLARERERKSWADARDAEVV